MSNLNHLQELRQLHFFRRRRVVHTLYFQVNVGTLVNQLAHLYEGAFVLSAYTILDEDFVILEGEGRLGVALKSPTIAGRVFNVAAN